MSDVADIYADISREAVSYYGYDPADGVGTVVSAVMHEGEGDVRVVTVTTADGTVAHLAVGASSRLVPVHNRCDECGRADRGPVATDGPERDRRLDVLCEPCQLARRGEEADAGQDHIADLCYPEIYYE